MKKVFIVLGLVAIVQFSLGSNPTEESLGINSNKPKETKSEMFAPIFRELDGNLFIALRAKESIDVEDGDIIEFEFARGRKLISFHINDANQELVDSGRADLFIMVYSELALELKTYRVKKVNIRHGNTVQSIEVNRFWIPDEYLTSM